MKNSTNTNNKRTIFIGDIHGCFDEFMLLLEKLKITKDDTVYILGDLINKGPKSFEVVEYIYNNRKQFKAIKGNHEVIFIKYINKTRESLSQISKDTWDILYKKMENKLELFNYLKRLPYIIEKDDFICVHAGFRPKIDIKKQDKDDLVNIRTHKNKPWYKYKLPTKKTIFYGHWAINGLKIKKRTIGLDTSCVYGKELSAYILEEKRVVQQQALKAYCKIEGISITKKLQIAIKTKKECVYQRLRNLLK